MMDQNAKSNRKSAIALILLVLGMLNVAAWLFIWNKQEPKSLENENTRLTYLETLEEATLQLLNRKYEQAFEIFEQADQLEINNIDWSRLAEAYVNQRMEIRDSLRFLSAKLGSDSAAMDAYNQLTETLITDMTEKEEQIRIYREVIENIKDEFLTIQRNYSQLMRSNANLEAKVEELNSKPTQIKFKNSKDIEIRYFGEIVRGMANGYGVGLYSTGSVYDGEWKDNTRHGKGKYTWANGDYYQGAFNNDVREGYGVYYFKSGERYEGNWKNELRDGQGIFFDKNGKVLLEGLWKEDKFIEKNGK